MIEIKNNAEVADIYIYNEIVSNSNEKWFDEICPEDVITELSKLDNKPLNIHINSYGGSVFGGIALYNVLANYKAHKTIIIESCACSIASVLAMAGDTIKMYNSSYMMIHRAWCGGLAGNAMDLRKQADILEQLDKTILDIYKTKLKDSYDVNTLIEKIDAESWLTANECAEIFNNIEIIQDEILAYAKVDKENFVNYLNNYKNVPQEIINELQNEEEIPQEEKVCEECGKNPCECEQQEEDAQVEEEKEQEIIDEVVEDDKKEEPQEEQQEDEEIPQQDEEKEEDKQVQIAQAKKELDFLNAKAFLEKYL